ncbi:STAS domain-containing protein [Actinomycetospora flava]|uniref:STAS domain-containing protein n=1 Tax=Actinomycetospora flava TaxID=3129232 RepID=A0ABU8MDH3_9PSEU
MIDRALRDLEGTSPGPGPVGGERGFRAELIQAADDNVLVLRGVGDLDLATRDEVRKTAEHALRSACDASPATFVAPSVLVADLSRATYLEASVVSALLDQAQRAPTLRAARLVIDPTGVAARVVALLRLGEVFEILDDLDEALTGGPRGST